MAQSLNFPEIFDDCTQRLLAGESLSSCLSRYPAEAERLRPLLELVIATRALAVPDAELREDQALVWQRIQQRDRLPVGASRRTRPFVQLLAATFLLMVLLTATWFGLTRPDQNGEVLIDPLPTTQTPVLSATPTLTLTFTATPTVTLTLSATPTPTLTVPATSTLTVTPSLTPTPTLTLSATTTPTARPSATPSATFAPGCGAPLTAEDARARVLAIYPNTTITSVTQQVKFGGTLVWEVRTSHQLVIDVDVACGTILTITRLDTQQSGSSTSGSGNSGGTTENTNDDNDNDNDNDDDNGGNSGSNDNGDDDE